VKKLRFFNLSFYLFSLAASSGLVWAQVGGSISGKVQDATGLGVGGATVTVKRLDTGATRVATTDESGNYRALSLSVGGQEVRVEKTGFKTAIRTGVSLEA
jgi:hypothetical protein